MKTFVSTMLLVLAASPALAYDNNTYRGGVGGNPTAGGVVQELERRTSAPYALTGAESHRRDLKFVTVHLPRSTTPLFVHQQNHQ